MIIFDDSRPRTLIQRLDPRLRILCTAAWAAMACACDRGPVLAALLVGALLLVLGSGLAPAAVLRRLASLNLVLLFFAALLPLSVPGSPFLRLGPLAWSEDGFLRAGTIALRANSIVLVCTALLGTLEPAHLGIALRRLGLSAKLVQIFLFMIRYIEAIHHEYHRLRDAMKLRAFRARCDLRTLRAIGYLIGMMLVRGADRAERVLAAMRCRAFRGEFPVLETFRLAPADCAFALGLAAALCLLGCAQWM